MKKVFLSATMLIGLMCAALPANATTELTTTCGKTTYTVGFVGSNLTSKEYLELMNEINKALCDEEVAADFITDGDNTQLVH